MAHWLKNTGVVFRRSCGRYRNHHHFTWYIRKTWITLQHFCEVNTRSNRGTVCLFYMNSCFPFRQAVNQNDYNLQYGMVYTVVFSYPVFLLFQAFVGIFYW